MLQNIINITSLIANVCVLLLTAMTFYLTALSNKMKFVSMGFSSSVFDGDTISLCLENTTLHSISINSISLLKRMEDNTYREIDLISYEDPLVVEGRRVAKITTKPYTYILGLDSVAVYDGETLMDAILPKRSFCIETLLPEGISMLGGAPKIGKSWMVLDIGLHVAKGIPIWNLPTRKGSVLYLALEDSLFRIQDRLNRLTDEAPVNLFFAIVSGKLADTLCSQIEHFVSEHRDTVLVIIDTFQIVRNNGIDTSYSKRTDSKKFAFTISGTPVPQCSSPTKYQ